MSATQLPPPMAGGTWDTANIGDLIAVYCSSSSPMGTLTVTALGQVRAVGGDPKWLPLLKARRDEVVAYLTEKCHDCGENVATRLAKTDNTVAFEIDDRMSRVCEDCFQHRVRVLLAADEATKETARLEAVTAELQRIEKLVNGPAVDTVSPFSPATPIFGEPGDGDQPLFAVG